MRVALEVDVARNPRSPTGGGTDPPITTQGSLGPSTSPVPAVVDLPVPGLGNVSIPAPFVATPVEQPSTTSVAAQQREPTILPMQPRQPPALPPAWTSEGQ
jgi:hypothetical protein